MRHSVFGNNDVSDKLKHVTDTFFNISQKLKMAVETKSEKVGMICTPMFAVIQFIIAKI